MAATGSQEALSTAPTGTPRPPPSADHHLHALSPAAAKLLGAWVGTTVPTQDAKALIAQLDEAGITRGVVLSHAYWFGSPLMPRVEGDEYGNVRVENDWLAHEVALRRRWVGLYRHRSRCLRGCHRGPRSAHEEPLLRCFDRGQRPADDRTADICHSHATGGARACPVRKRPDAGIPA